MTTPAVMFQGTGSDVGKSLIVAGLARAYHRRGLAVRPFKPQNMSNNAAVTGDGGEIGRAQALQARASGVTPSVDMNPVLLKPQTEVGAQIVVRGKVRGTADARAYQTLRLELLPEVIDSFERVALDADIVLVEGAGSAAEVNLRDGDIANMGFALAAGVPVVLVGDIERGGVIASMVGTVMLLTPEERAAVGGFLINRFRGDVSLFEAGLREIESHTGLDSLGVVPYFADAMRLPAEDALALPRLPCRDNGAIRIAVPRLSRIANFDDLDPLRAEPDVAVDVIAPDHALPGDADLVILPGTKATLDDLRFLRDQGWDVDILAHIRRGGAVLGICGGFQLLGNRVSDPQGIEGSAGEAEGLGLLDVDTLLAGDKTLVEVEGVHAASGESVRGFEMHMGRTQGTDCARPFVRIGGRDDGATSPDGRVFGCYLHGLFAADGFRHAFLNGLRTRRDSGLAYEDMVDDVLDRLAAHLEACLDLERILQIARQR